MKIPWKPYILFILLALVLNSCRKKEVINIITPPKPVQPKDSSKIDEFFKNNMVASQFFTINAASDQVIVGNQGTRITIKKGAFNNSSGNPIDAGIVSIELKEIYSNGDMINSGIFPVAYSRPLVSGGEFYFLAKQNGSDLVIKDTGLVYFKLPYQVTDTNKMSVFNSFSTILQSKTDTFGWGSAIRDVRTIDSASLKLYQFTIDRMYWINCDYFMNSTLPKTTVYAELTDTIFNYTNTMVFFALKGNRAAGRLYQYPYKDFRVYNIPVDLDVTFFAIAERNGQYYMGYIDAKIVAGHRQQMSLNKCTLADIKIKLTTL